MTLRSACLSLAVLLAASPAFAQDPPPPTHEQIFEAAYVGVSGNASSSTFGLGADVISRPVDWLFRNKVSFVRNESNGRLTATAFDLTSRAQRSLNARASVFGEYGFFRDEFAGVLRRNSVTAGVAVKAVETSRQTLTLDAGAGYTHERRLARDDMSSGSYLLGATYTGEVSETAALTDDVKLSGFLSDSARWRLEHTVAVTTKLAGGLSLKVSNVVRYANAPPPGFKKTDVVTSVAVVATFSQR